MKKWYKNLSEIDKLQFKQIILLILVIIIAIRDGSPEVFLTYFLMSSVAKLKGKEERLKVLEE